MEAPERDRAVPLDPVRGPGQPAGDAGAPWTRGQRLMLLALVIGMLASLSVTVHPWFDQANDAALYIHTARSILAGEGYSYFGVPFVIRPPGFALMIAPFAAHPTSFLALNTMVSLTGVLCVALMFAFYRPRLGTAVSTGLCVFVWLNPIFQELRTQVMSDVPGTAFVFGALLLDRAARRRPTVGRHVLLGLCIAAGLYVRSVCMLLVPAVLLARLVQGLIAGRPDRAHPERVRAALRTAWPVLVIPAVAWMPWSLRNANADIPVPPEHVYLHSYSTALWHEHPAFPDSPKLTLGQVLERVPVQLDEMLPLLGAGYREKSDMPKGLAIAVSVLGVLCATAILIRRRSPAEFLFGGVLMVLAIYFAFKPRLALTLFVLGPPAICEVALWSARTPRARRAVAAVLTLLLVVPSALVYAPRAGHPALESSAQERARLVRFFDKRLAPGEPVGLPVGWHVGVETDRPIYGLTVTAQRLGLERALEMVPSYGLAALAASQRRESGQEFGKAFSKVFPRYRAVGSWAVFFVE